MSCWFSVPAPQEGREEIKGRQGKERKTHPWHREDTGWIQKGVGVSQTSPAWRPRAEWRAWVHWNYGTRELMKEVNGTKESSGLKWAKQPLPQAGLVPGLGGAGGWMEPQAGGAPGAAVSRRMLQSTPLVSHLHSSAGVQQHCCPSAASLCAQEGLLKGRWAAN